MLHNASHAILLCNIQHYREIDIFDEPDKHAALSMILYREEECLYINTSQTVIT